MKRYCESYVLSHKNVTGHIYAMVLLCPEIAKDAACGQFINIYLDKGEMILPRPISICDADKEAGTITIMYQIAGKGTEYMSTFEKNKKIFIAGPLGNGFTLKKRDKIALIGGGIGAPPMYMTAKSVLSRMPGTEISVYLGFRNKDMVILEDEFKALGVNICVSTDDGSYGFSGNALKCYEESGFKADEIYACGPSVMLKFIARHAADKGIECQVSMEERMGCGIGACVGCAIPIVASKPDGFEYKKVCKDGPVFYAGEVLWQ